MSITFRGRWRLTVVEKRAAFDQRFVISRSDSSDGNYHHSISSPIIVDGRDGWQIQIQHNDGSGWDDSLMRLTGKVISGTHLRWNIESEDLPDREPKDWNDLVLRAEKIGPIIEVPIRPYAVVPGSLQMMPDGIFEAALGQYFMGVRITNIWGDTFRPGQSVDITSQSRALLAAQGIQVIDAWTQQELQAFNQELSGSSIKIDALQPFASRIIYFKVDCSAALPHKPAVELICLDPIPMPDPNSADRKASHKIYVTRSYIDPVTHEMVAEAPEGKVKMTLKEAIVDTISGRKGRKKRPPAVARTPSLEELQSILKELLHGRRVDPCRLRKVLECYCECKDIFDGDYDPRKPRDGRFVYDPFVIFPTHFTYQVDRPSFEGTHGPLAFEDPWWKCLLLIIALVLLVAGMISEGADLAYHDEDLIIGTLEDWQQNDLDVALTRLNDHRTMPSPFLQYLDAQSGEASTIPVEPDAAPVLGGEISISGEVMPKTEIQDIIDFGTRDNKRVFKSGARTGLTIALIDDLVPWSSPRGDDGTTFSAVPQVHFVRDPDNDMPINKKGDSGSVWIHKNTRKLVALHHSGSSNDSGNSGWGSPMEDIVAQMGIRFM
jgi:hypothetical protein